MSNFIAKIGYILMWAFGTPEYSLEEKFEEYYKFGLAIIIVGIFAMTYLITLIVLILKRNRGIWR